MEPMLEFPSGPMLGISKSYCGALLAQRHSSSRTNVSVRSFPHLKKFLHHAPALEHLRLNFDDGSASLLDWLARKPKASAIAYPSSGAAPNFDDPVPLAHLNTLDIGMLSVDQATLLKVLSRFELKAFNLWRITLEVDDRHEFKDPDRPNPAKKFIEGLAKVDATKHVERAMLGGFKVNSKNNSRYRAYDVDFAPVSSPVPKHPKPSNSVRRSSKSSQSPKRVDMKTRTVNFSLGGSAPDFGAWAKETASRATIKKTSGGYEVPFSDSEDADAEDFSDYDSDDSEDDIDAEDDEGESGDDDGDDGH